MVYVTHISIKSLNTIFSRFRFRNICISIYHVENISVMERWECVSNWLNGFRTHIHTRQKQFEKSIRQVYQYIYLWRGKSWYKFNWFVIFTWGCLCSLLLLSFFSRQVRVNCGSRLFLLICALCSVVCDGGVEEEVNKFCIMSIDFVFFCCVLSVRLY